MIFPIRPASTPLPLMSFVSALIVMSGASLFFSQFYKAIGLVIKLLTTIFTVGTVLTQFLDDYRIRFTVLASLTFGLGFLVVVTDYLHIDARYSERPICEFCQGSLPIFVVSAHR